MNLTNLIADLKIFELESHKILGQFDSSESRVQLLKNTYDSLLDLSITQDDLLRQALRCTEAKVFRAAHVMAWSATADYLEEFCGEDGFVKINLIRSNWNVLDKEDLKERFTEFAIIEAMKAAGMIKKAEMKAFHGMLSKRNECAHPSNYFPDYNQTLGYISEIIDRLRTIQIRRGYVSA